MPQDNNSKKKYLTDYNKSDLDWDIHKASTDKISYFYHTSFNSNHHKYSQRMDSCAELLRFNFVDDIDTGESKLKLNQASFCRVRLCPVCQWRRSMAWRGRMFNKLPSLLEEHPEYEFIFLTLTVKNCSITSLASTLEDMNKAWNRLRLRKEFKHIQGFLRATEVTKGGDGSAHPHFHTILVVKKSYFQGRYYIKTSQWAEVWQQCLKVDYLPICDVRKVKKQAKGQGLEVKAICELLKYTTKIKDLLDDQTWFLELSDQLYKKRFLASGGCLKDMLKEDTSNQEMIIGDSSSDELEQDELKKKSLYFGWEQQVKKYKKVKNPYTGN